MNVTLLLPDGCADSAQFSDYLLKRCWTAARTCYSEDTPEELWAAAPSPKRMQRLLDDVIIPSGHLSVLRHAEISYAISGISRACSHQLVRHHVGFSPEQQSQRYTTMSGADVVIPPSIANNPAALDEFSRAMQTVEEVYTYLQSFGIPNEDARFVLPNACTTNLVLTMNLNSLITVCGDRLCSLSQWEIRKLFAMIRNRTIKAVPFLKNHLVIKCQRLGYCPEIKGNADGHCRIRPLKAAVLAAYAQREATRGQGAPTEATECH
jgi:thymidylate synthase (FAD)